MFEKEVSRNLFELYEGILKYLRRKAVRDITETSLYESISKAIYCI